MAQSKKAPLQIDRILGGLRQQLSEDRETRTDILARLAQGEDAQADLDALDTDIKQARRKISQLEDAKREGEKRNSSEARRQRHAQVTKELRSVVKDASDLGESARNILLKIVDLGTALSEIDDKRRSLSDRFYDAVYQVDSATEKRANLVQRMESILRGLTLPGHFTEELWRAGVGDRGVNARHWVSILPIKASDGFTVDELIARNVDAAGNLAEQIVAASEQSNPEAEAEA